NVWRLEDPDDLGSFRLVASNPAASRASGIALQAKLGTTMQESFPEALGTSIPGRYAAALRSGQAENLGDISPESHQVAGTIFAVTAFPLAHNLLAVAFEDVTERRRATEELQRRDAQLAFLAQASAVFASSLDYEMTLRRVADVA